MHIGNFSILTEDDMEKQENVKVFPVKCAQCKREIVDGMIYYHDKEKGFICEACPGFEKGGIEVDTTED